MRKKSQVVYWVVLVLFVVGVIFVLQYYANISNKDLGSGSGQIGNETSELADANENIDQDNQAENSTGGENDSSETATAQEVLENFLKAISGQQAKSNVKNYTTSQFYASSFVVSIITGSASGPDNAIIISEGEKSGDNLIFQVKESYNISNTNNAGANGTYFYALIKSQNQWLVNFRGETKP